MVHIENKEDLEVALKEYELLTNHYLHEDNMKTYALRNSVIVVVTIISIIMMIIAFESNSIIIKQLFCMIMGYSGIIISLSYGIQYRRILRYQEVREARLEELEKNFEESNFFAPMTIRYGLKLMDYKKLQISNNNFKQYIELGKLEIFSSSSIFKFLIPWGLIILLIIFLVVVLIGLRFGIF